jgi:predicted Zn-dependent protease
VEYLQPLATLSPRDPALLNNLALAYAGLQDRRALEFAEEAYKLNTANPAVADTLGWLLVQQGDPKRGLALLKTAASAAPGVYEIQLHLAQATARVGDRQLAIDQLERLISTNPGATLEKQALAMLRELRAPPGQPPKQ